MISCVAWMHFLVVVLETSFTIQIFVRIPLERQRKIVSGNNESIHFSIVILLYKRLGNVLTCALQNGFRHMICSIFSTIFLTVRLSLSQSFWPQVPFFSTCFTALIIIALHWTFHSVFWKMIALKKDSLALFESLWKYCDSWESAKILTQIPLRYTS